MNFQQREFLINRIVSNIDFFYHNSQQYFLRHPSKEVRALSSYVYEEVKADAVYNEWLSEQEATLILHRVYMMDKEVMKSGVKDISHIIKNLNKTIDDAKLNLFREFLHIKKRARYKTELKLIKDKLVHWTNVLHSFDYLTSDGYASMVKVQFLSAMSLCDEAGKPLFHPSEFKDIDFDLINKAIKHLNENRLDTEDYRDLVRNEPWRSYWSARKEDVFGLSAIDLSDDQRALLLYSKMYDSIYNHPECPQDDVVNDDDALDGWLIDNRKKAEREKKVKETDAMLGEKGKNASEILIPAQSMEHAKSIEDMNDMQGKLVKMERKAIIEKRGVVKEAELPDVKLSNQIKQVQASTKRK